MKIKQKWDFIIGADTKTIREKGLQHKIDELTNTLADLRQKTEGWLNERDSAVIHFQNKFHEKNDELSRAKSQLNKLNSEQSPLKNYINELIKKITFLEIENVGLKELLKNEINIEQLKGKNE